jgi:hypothetical protein
VSNDVRDALVSDLTIAIGIAMIIVSLIDFLPVLVT